MDLIPIDDTGCFVKYTFPDDIPLPSTSLQGGYQSDQAAGYKMMYSSTNGINLKRDIEYFIRNQGFSNGNYIILRGCSLSGNVGTGQKAKVKFNGITTPSAQKTTGDFKIEVYKNFNPTSYALTDLITTIKGNIDSSKFTSGQIGGGIFSGFVNFIQMRAAHVVQFKIQNTLPAKNTVYDSRIVIIMPLEMTADTTNAPSVQNLDGSILNAQIAVETAFGNCGSGAVVCYSITHSNTKAVPAGSIIRMNIVGTVNQNSVRDAGKWSVQT